MSFWAGVAATIASGICTWLAAVGSQVAADLTQDLHAAGRLPTGYRVVYDLSPLLSVHGKIPEV